MSDWVQCTSSDSGETIYINLDMATAISKTDEGTSITLVTSDEHVVNEPLQQLITLRPMRSRA